MRDQPAKTRSKLPSKRTSQLQMIKPVDRMNMKAELSMVLKHIERDVRACVALRPDLAVKIRQILRLFAIDGKYDVALPQTGLLGRRAGRNATHDQVPADIVRVDS